MDPSTPASAPKSVRTQASLPVGAGLSACAWLLSRVVVGLAWPSARNPFAFDPGLWFRWDSGNYLAIAQRGSTFVVCPGYTLSRYLGQHFCGTAAWLPGYPWLIRVVHALGVSWLDAAVILSWAALAVALFLVWFGWGRDLAPGRALALLVAFGLFPGAVYNFAIFPTSLALALTVGAIVALSRERMLVASSLALGAGLCYPSAWFAIVGLAAGLVVLGRPRRPADVARHALWGLAGLFSIVVLAFYDVMATNHVDAFWRLQAGVRSLTAPWSTLVQLVVRRDSVDQIKTHSFYGAMQGVQTVVAVVGVAGAVVVAALAWLRRRGDALVLPAAAGMGVTAGMLLFPSTGAFTRSIVLAAPAVVVLRRASPAMLVTAIVVLGVTTALVSGAFFNGTLV